MSQVKWISEKENIIAVVDKNSGVYLMLQVHLFVPSKFEFLERRGLKQKLHERKRNTEEHQQYWNQHQPFFDDRDN